jgi:hypothetical protein
MGQAVQQGGRQLLVAREDRDPLREREVECGADGNAEPLAKRPRQIVTWTASCSALRSGT